MRPIFTICCLLLFCGAFAQSDSFLQSLIDSAKAGGHQPLNPRKAATVPPQKRDSQHVARMDTARFINKDSGRVRVSALDSAEIRLTAGRDSLNDSLHQDSAMAVTVIPPAIKVKPKMWQEDTAFARLLSFLTVKSKMRYVLKDGEIHLPPQKDYLFYLLVAIVLLLAIIKQLFPKYFNNIFQLIFQASFRQKQTREQMMMQVVPSFLMNILFVLVGGLFIALLAQIYQWLDITFWLLTVYSITLLAIVYIFKYLVIKFMGWVFNAGEQASTYGFIVFLVNKVIGLALLPLSLLLAFSNGGQVQQVVLTLAGCVVILLLIFRYIVSLTIIRNTLSIHPLHFFIYLCAIEIMPMLILYKVLFSFVGRS